MPETEAKLNIVKRGAVCVVEFEDRKILEELVINRILEQLTELASAEPEPKLLLDFHKVEHLSSAALGVLITLNKQVVQQQGKLVLACINPQIYEVFKITRLNKLFNIQSSIDLAMQEFA